MEKIKIPEAILELDSTANSAIHRENGPNRLNWQCSLAGSSKTAPTMRRNLLKTFSVLKF